jgi:hypothetical protein
MNLGLFNEETMQNPLDILDDLIKRLIKLYGNGKPTNLEIFIRPYLLRANIAVEQGEFEILQ